MFKTMCTGRLGKDSIIKEVKDKSYVAFTMAVNPFYNSEPIWVEVMFRTDRTGIVEHLKKGRQVYLEGRLDGQVDEFNGNTRVRYTLWASECELLGSKPE